MMYDNNFKLPFPRLYIKVAASSFEEYLEKFDYNDQRTNTK